MANRARRIRERAQAQWPGAIVVERGPGYIKHRHPTIPNLFMLDSAVGDTLHYGPSSDTEIDSAWQAGVAPWDYQMVNAPYNAFALANFASGQIVRYMDPLQFGAVWVNTHFMITAEMPHGGYKESGYGKDMSMYSLEDYTQIKHVMWALD